MIISPDDLLPPGPRRWTKALVGEAWAQSYRALRSALQDPGILTVVVMVGCPGSGKSTWARDNDADHLAVFDACWSEPGRRRGIVAQVRTAGRRAVALWVRTPVDLCRERNARRAPGRRVPDGALVRSHLALRRYPPSMAEGWSRVVTWPSSRRFGN